MDDAELPAVKQPVMTPLQRQGELDAKADAIMERIWKGVHDRDYIIRGLKPVALYLGVEDYDTMRAWSKAQHFMEITSEGDSLMGLKLHRVSAQNHFCIVWEPE